MGRVIRHRLDFGTVFLIDERYNHKSHLTMISPFIMKSLSKNTF